MQFKVQKKATDRDCGMMKLELFMKDFKAVISKQNAKDTMLIAN